MKSTYELLFSCEYGDEVLLKCISNEHHVVATKGSGEYWWSDAWKSDHTSDEVCTNHAFVKRLITLKERREA